MAEFTGKEIARAVYTNEAHDTIMVEYYNGKVLADGSRVLIPVYISSDPNATPLKALFAEGYDFERIQKETVLTNQQQALAWRQMVKAEAAIEINKIKAEYQQKYEDYTSSQTPVRSDAIIQTVFDNNTNEELLFKSKLLIFEAAEFKPKLTKPIKASIRTAKTLIDLINIINSLK
jgi:hypothetical protein